MLFLFKHFDALKKEIKFESNVSLKKKKSSRADFDTNIKHTCVRAFNVNCVDMYCKGIFSFQVRFLPDIWFCELKNFNEPIWFLEDMSVGVSERLTYTYICKFDYHTLRSKDAHPMVYVF